MATQSGQGMRNQGAMAQGVWGTQSQPPPGAPPQGVARPQVTYSQIPQMPGQDGGVRMAPDVTSGQGGRSISPSPVGIGTPPPGMQVPGSATPGVPATPGAPPTAPGTPGAPGAPETPTSVAPQAPGAEAPRPGPVAPGTLSPSGTPVGPDGGYKNPDGSHDWMPGYGPQMSFGGQEIRTGRAPVAPDPGDPDKVTGGARGTPQWRAAYAAHDAWIKQNLDAGLHLADLGLTPVRGGGLSAYMRYGGYAPTGAGAQPAAPAAPPPPGPNTGGALPGTSQMSYGQGDLQSALIQLLMQGQGQ